MESAQRIVRNVPDRYEPTPKNWCDAGRSGHPFRDGTMLITVGVIFNSLTTIDAADDIANIERSQSLIDNFPKILAPVCWLMSFLE